MLALDTTTRGGSVAVAEDDRILALVPGDESRTHGERLPGEIAAALERAGIGRDRIDLLAVATGPGGFTGLRIGLAAVQGLAMTLNKPVAGVSALDALAAQVSDADAAFIVPWMDAQRGDVFASLIDARSRQTIEPPVAANPSALLVSWSSRMRGAPAVFVGDAVARDAALIAGGSRWRAEAPSPLAPQIAALARRMAEKGEAGPPHALTPIYVRRPDAEVEREHRRLRLQARITLVQTVIIERLASPADLDGVLEIEEASFNNPTTREWYERELSRPDVCFIYVLRTAEVPVAAFCAFWLVMDQLHINNLAVRPEMRRRGLGSRLLEAVVAEARRMGAGILTLEVRESNDAARRLYEHAGFHVINIRKSYYTNPVEDALILVRNVDGNQAESR